VCHEFTIFTKICRISR
jgi:hypothetical protein